MQSALPRKCAFCLGALELGSGIVVAEQPAQLAACGVDSPADHRGGEIQRIGNLTLRHIFQTAQHEGLILWWSELLCHSLE